MEQAVSYVLEYTCKKKKKVIESLIIERLIFQWGEIYA